jgi:hypothetical protein
MASAGMKCFECLASTGVYTPVLANRVPVIRCKVDQLTTSLLQRCAFEHQHFKRLERERMRLACYNTQTSLFGVLFPWTAQRVYVRRVQEQ